MATKAPEKVQSVRLTEDMRRDITRALLDHKLAKRRDDYAKAEFKLAQRIYVSLFSPADCKKIEALPDGWMLTQEYLRVKAGSNWNWFHFGPPEKGGKREQRRIPANCKEVVEVSPASEVGQAILAYLAEGAAITKEDAALREKANSVLASVTTTARLAEVWPEVVAFIPKYVPRQLPAVRRDELNAAFGLRAA